MNIGDTVKIVEAHDQFEGFYGEIVSAGEYNGLMLYNVEIEGQNSCAEYPEKSLVFVTDRRVV